MEKTTTPFFDLPSPVRKPRRSTVKFLLDYSSSLEVLTTANGRKIEITKN